MLDMVRREILPAVIAYTDRLMKAALRKRELGVNGNFETKLTEKLSALTDRIAETADGLEHASASAQACSGNEEKARRHREAANLSLIHI